MAWSDELANLHADVLEQFGGTVLLIRHSLSVTTWGQRAVGDHVNLEVDQMARYAARLAETAASI